MTKLSNMDIIVIVISFLSIIIFIVWSYYYCTRIVGSQNKQNIECKDNKSNNVDKIFDECELV